MTSATDLKPLWIMQTNMGNESDISDYVAAVKASGAAVVEVSVIPMSGELPDVEHDGPVVVYGAVSFVTAAQADGRWSPGVFADPTVFTYENWARHYNEMLLNSPDATKLTTVGTYGDYQGDADIDIFVRPQHDTKSLVGMVWTAGEFSAWCRKVRGGGYADLDADTPIVIGTPFGIESEYRLFVVDGEIVSSTLYKSRGKLSKIPALQKQCWSSVERRSRGGIRLRRTCWTSACRRATPTSSRLKDSTALVITRRTSPRLRMR